MAGYYEVVEDKIQAQAWSNDWMIAAMFDDSDVSLRFSFLFFFFQLFFSNI